MDENNETREQAVSRIKHGGVCADDQSHANYHVRQAAWVARGCPMPRKDEAVWKLFKSLLPGQTKQLIEQIAVIREPVEKAKDAHWALERPDRSEPADDLEVEQARRAYNQAVIAAIGPCRALIQDLADNNRLAADHFLNRPNIREMLLGGMQ